MFDSWKARRAARIYNRGLKLIDEGDYARAFALGQRLVGMRFSGGWEIQGLSLREQGRFEEAEEILQTAVTRAPSVWTLWKLLGDTLSDLNRWGQASAAYGKAVSIRGADEALVRYNWAIALQRAQEPQAALEQLQLVTVETQPHRLKIQTLIASVLCDLHRLDDALAVCTRAMPLSVGDDEEDRAQLLGEQSRAQWLKGDREGARGTAQKALAVKFVSRAASVLRETADERSAGAKSIRLVVEGKWLPPPGGERPFGFLRTIEVVAEHPEEALKFIRDFEPAEVGGSLRIESSEELGARADQLKGVYWASSHIFH